MIKGTRRRPWLQRRISRAHVYWAMALSLFVWLGLLAGTLFWLYKHWYSDVQLSDQALMLHLPDQLLSHVDFRSKIDTQLSTRLALRVPIKQNVPVILPSTVSGQSHVEVSIPVSTSISHQFTTRLETTVNAPVSIASWLPDIHVTLPLTLDIPVAVRIPVKATIPVSFNVQATAKLPSSIMVPIDTQLDIQVPIHQALSIDAVHKTLFALRTTDEGIGLTIKHAQMHMPLSTLALLPLK